MIIRKLAAKKKKRVWDHRVFDLCHRSIRRSLWLRARILLIVLEDPVAPVNISGPEAPAQLVSNWVTPVTPDMVMRFGRWIGEKTIGFTVSP